MLRIVLFFSLFLAAFQASTKPRVNRIFVESPYNASIIFEYANASIPEDQPLRDGAIDCLVSELQSTGLFTDVRITLKPLEGAQKVDVNIAPTWIQQREGLVIEEIVFDDFTGIDEAELRRNLQAKGFAQGAPLLQHPIQRIQTEVQEAAREIFKNEPKRADDVAEQLSELSVRLRLVAPSKVRLRVATGVRNLCQELPG
jgi:hypothetical protein